MKIKEQKPQSFSNGKLPYEKPVLHVLSELTSTNGKTDNALREELDRFSFGPS